MKYNKTITLRDGQPCLLKNPSSQDAEQILQLMIQTSAETNYMGRYADEITTTVEEERAYLSRLETDPKGIMICAVLNGEIIANAGCTPVEPHERCRHRAGFGISVKKDWWQIGVGTALLSAAICAAREAGYEQMELDVVTGNTRAVALYKKLGFQIYGTRRKSFKYRDGSYADLHLMLLEL